jgi:hypothetical protein
MTSTAAELVRAFWLVASNGRTFMERGRTQAFWAELSACDHFVQIYESDDVFMDTLAGYVAGGLRAGQGVIIIATPDHRQELDERLSTTGLDVTGAKARDQFISVDAQETLATFAPDGWPDDKLFTDVVTDLLGRAGRNGRKIRAFGEMVALLWANGNAGATVRLEHLWHELCARESFSLFCAYPKVGFTEHPRESLSRICAMHSKVLAS